jgi:PAS domain S-box-containing protein
MTRIDSVEEELQASPSRDELRVLLVEDSATDAALVLKELRKAGRPLRLERVEDAAAMRAALDREAWDLVISDWSLPGFGAPAALAIVKERGLDIPFIIVSGTVGEETAIVAMRGGAHDYVLKDKLARLVAAVERELRESHLRADRRRTHQALLESEARYRRIVETTNQGVLVVDAAGRITFANARVAAMLGHEPGELLGRSPLDLADPAVRQDMAISMGKDSPVQSERKLRRKDGSALWVLLEATPLLGEGGRSEGSFAVLMDVTERKAAQEALVERSRIAEATADVALALAQDDPLPESLQRCADAMATHLDAAVACIWTLDAPGETLELQASAGGEVPDTVRRVSLGASDIGGVARDRRPRFGDARDGADLAASPWALDEGAVALAALPLVVATHLVGVVAMSSRRPLSEAVRRGLGALADALAVGIRRKVVESEGRSLEAQLRQAQKLEAIGRLAGGVAHDMNNMLAVVLAYSESLASSFAPDDPVALTRQLLAFGRKQVLKPRVVDLNEVLANVLKMVTTLIGADVEVKLALSSRPLWIEADTGQIEQVVMNLAVNARDAMPAGGQLDIATAGDGRRVTLSMSDTGTGMDATTRERIFEPFFTTKEPGKGTGLGLATVFGIVKQSHGEIRVRTEPGQGTTFTIELPTVPPPDARPRATRRDARAASGDETILLVEDSVPLRVALARTLRARGYRVLEAGAGDDALRAGADAGAAIDLLVSDVVLPGIGGPEVARRLRDRHPALKVLFMSGYADPSDHAARAIAEHDFLQKPFPPEVLVARVREVLDRGPP